MIFSRPQYSRLKSRIKILYRKEIQAVKKDFSRLPASPLKTWIITHFDEFSEYSSFNWYFLQQLKTYLFIAQMQPLLSLDDGFGTDEDIVFEKWNQSEFADVFLKELNRTASVLKSSTKAHKTFANHLIVLGERFALKNDKNNKSYRPQNSLGEINKKGKVSRLLTTTLHIDGFDLDLMTPTFKEMKLFSQRIETALKIIKKHSPTSWERFTQFTSLIIPIKQMELVSYSHQELPGVSMINLYDRDFVDLMDDLLHENGHHHLNYYLNLGKLIEEPRDNIYYSPWRRTLRPLRGIYHAYFTFFWAFKLFSDLAQAKDMDSIYYVFNEDQKEKIYWRAVEEFLMLEYAYEDLKWARTKKLIHETGWKLIQEQRKELAKFRKKISVWEKKITHHRSELKELKKALQSARKQYKKS